MGLFTWLSKRNLDFQATKATSQITIKIVLPPHVFFIVSRPSSCTEEGLFFEHIACKTIFYCFL